MATKNNPGEFDCYASAGDDEPLFVLRSTDPLAPALVSLWACLRGHHFDAARTFLQKAIDKAVERPRKIDDKFHEAAKCAHDMDAWRNNQ